MRRGYVKVHVFLIVALLFFLFALTDKQFNKLLHETKYVCDEEGVFEEKRAPVADVRPAVSIILKSDFSTTPSALVQHFFTRRFSS